MIGPSSLNHFRLSKWVRAAAALALFGSNFAVNFEAAGSTTRAPAHPHPAAAVDVQVIVDHVFDGAPLRMNALDLKNRAGNRLSISRLSYLISDVRLLTSHGAETPRLDSGAAYINPAEGRTRFTLSGIAPGRYTGIVFRIGLSPATNHSNPAAYPPGSALNPIVNRLHWGWQGGYVFCALEGRYVQPNGNPGGYSYHIATDALGMTVRLNRGLRIGRSSGLHVQFDIARIFDAVHTIAIQPENGGDSTHSRPGDKLACRIADNLSHAFRLGTIAPLTPTEIPVQAHSALLHSPKQATAFVFPVPEGFPQPALPGDNPLTVEGIALGKRLFFDKRLSGNDTQSCASCHQPDHAFSDGVHAVSAGIDGLPGTRRAMPLFNLAWSGGAYTWDGRRIRLRDQVLAPIQDTREMHQTLGRTLEKLRADPSYRATFAKAFGGSVGGGTGQEITAERLGLAVEQYLLTLISADSKFDRALRGDEKFTDEEKRGLFLFITEYDPARGQTAGGDCFHCHGGNLFTDYQFHNNGLDQTFLKDIGRFAVTGNDSDRGKFKTPSLRNVAARAPYMHDGRFATLEAVIDHYSNGEQPSDTLDPNIARHVGGGVHLSQADKRALVAFLKTLTDTRFGIPNSN